MTFAIKWGSLDSDESSGFIYFDAISASSANYRGQVTKHPIDSGGTISDHFIKENPVFQFTGIITGTDLSSSSYLIRGDGGEGAFNSKVAPASVKLKNSAAGLLQYLPSSVSQFLDKTSSEIVMDQDIRTDSNYEIACRDIIVNLIQGISYNRESQQLENKINLIELYEFDQDNSIRKPPTGNLVLTNFSVNETPESGDALLVDITLEQVEFATLKKEALPQDVKTSLKPKVSSKKNKGKQDSSVKQCAPTDPANTDAPGTDGDELKKIKYGETSSFSQLNTNGLGRYGS